MRSKYCQWWPCYLSDQDCMRTSQTLFVLGCHVFGLSEENIYSLRLWLEDKNVNFLLENLPYIICTNQSNNNHISHFLSIASDPIYHTVKMAIAKIWKRYKTTFHSTSKPIDQNRYLSYHYIFMTLCLVIGVSLDLSYRNISIKGNKWKIWF